MPEFDPAKFISDLIKSRDTKLSGSGSSKVKSTPVHGAVDKAIKAIGGSTTGKSRTKGDIRKASTAGQSTSAADKAKAAELLAINAYRQKNPGLTIAQARTALGRRAGARKVGEGLRGRRMNTGGSSVDKAKQKASRKTGDRKKARRAKRRISKRS